MLRFNIELFSELPKLLNISKRELCESIGMSRMWHTHVMKYNDAYLRYIVKLCNQYRIDIRCFIVSEEDDKFPSTLIIKERDWQNIEYHPSVIQTLWSKKGKAIVERKKLREDTGWDQQSITLMLNDERSSMRIGNWLELCNRYNLDYMMVFVDNNEWTNNATLRDKDREIKMLRQQLIEARLEANMLKNRIRQQNASLKMDNITDI